MSYPTQPLQSFNGALLGGEHGGTHLAVQKEAICCMAQSHPALEEIVPHVEQTSR